jgi:hypothetical protein
MAQEEVRRGYKIEILSAGDSAPHALAVESGVDETVAAARAATGETLVIDGKPVPFTRSAGGYNIYYMPAENTLIEAARKFVDTQPEKAQ